MKKGLVTIPTDKTFVEGTKKYIELWGADAVRDCDGVSLPDNVNELGCEVYKAYFIVREDHEYPKAHHEYLQNVALITKKHTAFETSLEIDLLENIFKDSIEVNLERYKTFWQVFDRTTGKIHTNWEYLGNNIVKINEAIKYHEYTVSFFGRSLWDPVQIYNYFSNDWKNVPHDVGIDPIYPEALNHMLERMEKWLKENPKVSVVRFTTFFYNFFIVYKEGKLQTHWDWHSYAMTASPAMFDLFEKTYGYKMTLEDLVTAGTYATRYEIPSETTRKYIDMVQKQCCAWAKLFVDLVHKYGKKAMMFDGDHRIGTEPYNPYFKTIGLDAVVGAPHSGPYIRLLSDMEGINYVEGRFAPYFFPNECPSDKEGTEFLDNAWNSEKRAMLRKPIDRIGFGGYLKLADTYPTFVLKVKHVCDEFRLIRENAGKKGAYTHAKVGIMSYWGKLNSWMLNGNFTDDTFMQSDCYSALVEALAGQPIDVRFISFDEVINEDISSYDVLITTGITGSSFQGDKYWAKEELLTKIREFVANGGGFIGLGDATGYRYQGHYFQLGDILGLEKELGFTYTQKRKPNEIENKHWILDDLNMNNIEFTSQVIGVYSTAAKVHVSDNVNHLQNKWSNSENIKFATNEYGKGRSAYFTGFKSSTEVYRLIYKTILWCAHKEDRYKQALSTNVDSDCFYYPEINEYALLNSSNNELTTTMYKIDGSSKEYKMKPHELIWIK